VDITSQESVEALFAQTGEVDAIVSTTGNLHFGPLSTMTDSQFNLGLQDKLLGQIRLALIGQHFLRDGGSITLVSGIVARSPLLRASMPRRSTPVWKALCAPPPANCRAGSASISLAPPCSASRWRPTATFSRALPASRRRRGAGLSPQH
jgi:NAD(P)-dependent dehydrogenase (short-subunit alcohol dehydrogenase family)